MNSDIVPAAAARRRRPGRPRTGTKNMDAQAMDGLGEVLNFFSPALKCLCDSPDLRARTERITYPAGLLRITMLVWMLTGGIPCDAFGMFIRDRNVADAISGLAGRLGYPPLEDADNQHVLPSVDLLRLEMERLPSDCLLTAFETAFKTAFSGGLLKPLEIGGKHLLAVDGTDGFSSRMPVGKLLSRSSGGKKTYFAKMIIASVVGIGLGGGLPAGALSIENSAEYDHCGSAEQKQACEQATLPRLLERLDRYCPLKNCILLLDGLYMNGVTVRLMHQYGSGYFMTLKDDALDSFHIAIDRQFPKEGHEIMCVDKECVEDRETSLEYTISWLNGIRYDFNNVHTPVMNYLCVTIRKYVNGSKCDMRKFTWITNISLNGSLIPLIQMIARRRWGIETQNNGQKHQGMNLTHKYDSRGNAPANFMYLAQMADLIRKILLYSDIYDRRAENATSHPVPATKKTVPGQKMEQTAQEPAPQEPAAHETTVREPAAQNLIAQEAVTREPAAQERNENKGDDLNQSKQDDTSQSMAEMLQNIRKCRKKSLKECRIKYWTSITGWCFAIMTAMKNSLTDWSKSETGFKMKWLKLDHLWHGVLHWSTENM